MAAEIGNDTIFAATTNRIEIPTANLGFDKSSKKLSSGYCDNDSQPEMAIRPPKPEIHISISGNTVITNSIEIPTADLGFLTTECSKKLYTGDRYYDRYQTW